MRRGSGVNGDHEIRHRVDEFSLGGTREGGANLERLTADDRPERVQPAPGDGVGFELHDGHPVAGAR